MDTADLHHKSTMFLPYTPIAAEKVKQIGHVIKNKTIIILVWVIPQSLFIMDDLLIDLEATAPRGPMSFTSMAASDRSSRTGVDPTL